MKVYFKKRLLRAQASIEFSMAFVLALVLMLLSCNLFVWFGHNMVQRQKGYETSRTVAASNSDPGKLNFYTTKKLNVFTPGGYE